MVQNASKIPFKFDLLVGTAEFGQAIKVCGTFLPFGMVFRKLYIGKHRISISVGTRALAVYRLAPAGLFGFFVKYFRATLATTVASDVADVSAFEVKTSK